MTRELEGKRTTFLKIDWRKNQSISQHMWNGPTKYNGYVLPFHRKTCSHNWWELIDSAQEWYAMSKDQQQQERKARGEFTKNECRLRRKLIPKHTSSDEVDTGEELNTAATNPTPSQIRDQEKQLLSRRSRRVAAFDMKMFVRKFGGTDEQRKKARDAAGYFDAENIDAESETTSPFDSEDTSSKGGDSSTHNEDESNSSERRNPKRRKKGEEAVEVVQLNDRETRKAYVNLIRAFGRYIDATRCNNAKPSDPKITAALVIKNEIKESRINGGRKPKSLRREKPVVHVVGFSKEDVNYTMDAFVDSACKDTQAKFELKMIFKGDEDNNLKDAVENKIKAEEEARSNGSSKSAASAEFVHSQLSGASQ